MNDTALGGLRTNMRILNAKLDKAKAQSNLIQNDIDKTKLRIIHIIYGITVGSVVWNMHTNSMVRVSGIELGAINNNGNIVETSGYTIRPCLLCNVNHTNGEWDKSRELYIGQEWSLTEPEWDDYGDN